MTVLITQYSNTKKNVCVPIWDALKNRTPPPTGPTISKL